MSVATAFREAKRVNVRISLTWSDKLLVEPHPPVGSSLRRLLEENFGRIRDVLEGARSLDYNRRECWTQEVIRACDLLAPDLIRRHEEESAAVQAGWKHGMETDEWAPYVRACFQLACVMDAARRVWFDHKLTMGKAGLS